MRTRQGPDDPVSIGNSPKLEDFSSGSFSSPFTVMSSLYDVNSSYDHSELPNSFHEDAHAMDFLMATEVLGLPSNMEQLVGDHDGSAEHEDVQINRVSESPCNTNETNTCVRTDTVRIGNRPNMPSCVSSTTELSPAEMTTPFRVSGRADHQEETSHVGGLETRITPYVSRSCVVSGYIPSPGMLTVFFIIIAFIPIALATGSAAGSNPGDNSQAI